MAETPIRLHSEKLEDLYRYWLLKKGRRPAPARAEIWPEEMRGFLPYLFLVDVIGEPPRFRFRLVGTKVVEACGADHTGDFFEDAALETRGGERVDEYRLAVAGRHPMARRWTLDTEDDRHLQCERLILPLSADGERVDMLLCGLAAQDRGKRAAR
ncbi:MAG TPA: PAS domain-containing protein [Alphaproteobacteria bacterium]|nr:PAS domain-containing protein [Alphaproteobacteria bacterium]